MNKKIDLKNLVDNFLKEGGKIKKIKTRKKSINNKLKKIINKQKKEKRSKFTETLKSRAVDLNQTVPRSEIWFRDLYEAHYRHFQDLYNKPFKKRYIPDVVNYKYQYIIEVDCSIHETEIQKLKDLEKDKFYTKHHFSVVRIKAFDNISYILAIQEIARIRKAELSKSFIDFKNLTSYNSKQETGNKL